MKRLHHSVCTLLATGAMMMYVLLPVAPGGTASPSETPSSAATAADPEAAAAAAAAPAKPEKPATNDERFHQRLLEIARDYGKWPRVDGNSRWAPLLCRAPAPPPMAKFSRADDADAHGRKIYSLVTNSPAKYLNAPNLAQPTEPELLVVVKETWKPVDVTGNEKIPGLAAQVAWPQGFYPYIHSGERVFKTAERAELFIMMQVPVGTPGSDEGWVYGTVSAEGKFVTGAGRMENCMSCHSPTKGSAQRHLGRLFGLPSELSR